MSGKVWFNGLVGALINGAFTGIGGSALGLPTKHILYLSGWSGAVGVFLYLKQHPTPWDGQDRRTTNETSQTTVTSISK